MKVNTKSSTALLAAAALAGGLPEVTPGVRTLRFRRMDHTEVGRPHVRYSNPIYTGTTEGNMYVFHQPFWDIYQVIQGNALVDLNMFAIPKGAQYTPAGGAAYIKTLWHTNMTLSSQIGQPNKLFVMGMNVYARTNLLPIDAVHLFWDALVSLIIDGRTYGTVDASRLGCGGGANGASSTFSNNGWPVNQNGFATEGGKGETVEQAQTFNVDFNPTLVIDNAGNTTYTLAATAAGGVGVDLKVQLDGSFYRSIG